VADIVTSTHATADDIRFLLDIMGSDRDLEGRAVRCVAALPLDADASDAALDALRQVRATADTAAARARIERAAASAQQAAVEPAATSGGAEVVAAALDAVFDERLPPDLPGKLALLPAAEAEELLTELVEVLLRAGSTGRGRAGLDRATRNLSTIVRWLTDSGRRPVAASATPDPRLAAVARERQVWADGVLGLVGVRAWLDLARRLTLRPERRPAVLTLLEKSGRRWGQGALFLQAPGRTGDWPTRPEPDLLKLLDLARPRERPTLSLGESPRPRGESATVAHPRLTAPERVDPGADFVVEVGLAPFADPMVDGRTMDVPDGGFRLAMDVVAEGCDLLDGNGLVTVDVLPTAPWPCVQVRLRAPGRPAAVQIIVAYAANGRPIGTASRTVHVGSASASPHTRRAAALRSGWDLPLDSSDEPDVDLIVLRDAVRSRLVWLGRSRYETARVEAYCDLPADVTSTMNLWMDGLDARRPEISRRRTYLNKVGRAIGSTVPQEVWELIRRAHDATRRPPTVLLSTQFGELPWELARIPVPWLDAPPVLGAQAELGTWPLPVRSAGTTAVPYPVGRLDLSAIAVLAWPDLRHAQEEATHLETAYGAKRLDLASHVVADCVSGAAGVQAFHLAAHGTAASGVDLPDDEVAFADMDIPVDSCGLLRLAFLNACELGRGRTEFAEYAGMAPALVGVGVQAVVAALWRIGDSMSRRLAKDFYRAVFVDGRSPAAFLREQRCNQDNGADLERSAYVYTGHPRLQVVWTGRQPNG
jgi:hypothetical protein